MNSPSNVLKNPENVRSVQRFEHFVEYVAAKKVSLVITTIVFTAATAESFQDGVSKPNTWFVDIRIRIMLHTARISFLATIFTYFHILATLTTCDRIFLMPTMFTLSGS